MMLLIRCAELIVLTADGITLHADIVVYKAAIRLQGVDAAALVEVCIQVAEQSRLHLVVVGASWCKASIC